MAAAEQYGTPLYLVDTSMLDAMAAELEAVFDGRWVRQYSLKANDSPGVVDHLNHRGWGANVVSVGEWQLAAAAGVSTEQISMEGIGKTDSELDLAVASCAAGRPLRWMSVESVEEAESLVRFAAVARLGRDGRPPIDVLIRINPAVEPETVEQFAVGSASSKFGMEPAEVTRLVLHGGFEPGVRFRGLHVHVGSGLRNTSAWSAAGVHAVRILRKLREHAPSADTIDFGGGFPAPDASMPAPGMFLRALDERLDEEGLALPPRPAIEPGRVLVASAGWLIGRVLHSRDRSGRRQVVVDAGMTELIRPALYGSVHPVRAVLVDNTDPENTCPTVVHGPICESTDTFGVHNLPRLRRGDLVAFAGVGAYGASMTSRYNGRPAPVETFLGTDGGLRCERRPVLNRRRVRS